MSRWTNINGTIIVSSWGRTQAELRYILDTVLEHLPRVTGSEGDMDVYTIQTNGHNTSVNVDEFGAPTNNLIDSYGDKSYTRGSLKCQDKYIIAVNGALRDRHFDQTFREFQKWLCRLSKRCRVYKVFVKIEDYDHFAIIDDNFDKYFKMHESYSWNNKGEINWCEYLMWDKAKYSGLPVMLEYKYYNNDENDAEVERRIAYRENQHKKTKR